MRIVAVLTLTVCQFTAFPFMAMVTANTVRQNEEAKFEQHADLPNATNVTTVYKTMM